MFKIRKFKSEDTNFLLSSWLRSYKQFSPLTYHITQWTFFKEHQKLIKYLLEQPATTVRIACDEEEEDLIIGYAVFEPRMIHFVYVKDGFRLMGIATKLLEGIEHDKTSHITYSLLDLWDAGKTKIQFRPYFLPEENNHDRYSKPDQATTTNTEPQVK